MRIGAEGFRLPDDERIFDLHGDRVLSARPHRGGDEAELIVRNLEGELIREIATGMQIPQTGIIRGDDVYFGGIDLGPDGTDIDQAADRGVWVAHGDASPEPILEAEAGLAVYSEIERSPDGRTVGIWRCGTICSTILVKAEGEIVEVEKPGLIALTDEVALLIGRFNDVTAYAVEDGAELWHAETEGLYFDRYATSDGGRIVLSTVEYTADGQSKDQLRVELLDAATGDVQVTVLVSTADETLRIEPSLSTDRFAAVLHAVLPSPDDGPHMIRVIDLEAGRLLDIELQLGDVPA